MKRPKPFLYPLRPTAPPETDYGRTVLRTGDQEQLTGVIQGMKASDLEERVARSLGTMEIPFQFRARISSQALGERRLTRKFANIKGEIEIDMLCDDGGFVTPIMVDGQISHFYASWQADQDQEKTDAVNEFGRRFGWKEVVRIPFWKLQNQEMADRTMREVFIR